MSWLIFFCLAVSHPLSLSSVCTAGFVDCVVGGVHATGAEKHAARCTYVREGHTFQGGHQERAWPVARAKSRWRDEIRQSRRAFGIVGAGREASRVSGRSKFGGAMAGSGAEPERRHGWLIVGRVAAVGSRVCTHQPGEEI